MNKILNDPDNAKRKFSEAVSMRSPFEPMWTEAAKHVLPRQYQGFLASTNPITSAGYGQSNTRIRSHDSTGRRMLPRFVSVLDRLLTPRGQRWHRLETDEEGLNKDRSVKEFYAKVSETLFGLRYKSQARFVSALSETYSGIGCFGNAAMTCRGRRRSPISRPGLVYRGHPIRDIYWLVNSDGDRDIVFARYWWNARQIEERFPEYANSGRLPPIVRTELDKAGGPSETRYYEVVEIITVNYHDHDPEALDSRRFAWNARVLMPEASAWLNDVEGLISNPYILPRYFTEPGDIYGTSPAIAAAPSMGGASAMKRHALKIGEKRADPAWLAHDHGILIDVRANAVIGGGLDSEGRPLVRRLDEVSGTDTRMAEVMLADERSDIEDTFLGRLFSILEETREMTAREVAERVSKEFALVAPTMGRMMEELIDPTVQRELDVITEDPILSAKLPDLPPALLEAEGEFEVVSTSPFARAERMEDVQGFIQAVEIAVNIASNAQRPEVLDTFDFDAAMPEVSEILNVPFGWLTSPEDLLARREEQQTQQQIEQAVQAAPAVAGLAQAASNA